MPIPFNASEHEDAARDRQSEPYILSDMKLMSALASKAAREREDRVSEVEEGVMRALKRAGLVGRNENDNH
jgi:hypothetical protein